MKVTLEGQALRGLLDALGLSEKQARRIYRLRMSLHGTTNLAVTFKVNEEMWSPPYQNLGGVDE